MPLADVPDVVVEKELIRRLIPLRVKWGEPGNHHHRASSCNSSIMGDEPVKGRLRGLRWLAAVLLLLLTAALLAPFLLTTQLVRLVLGQVFPTNSPSVGSATLSLSGTLVLHDLVLHDTGALAQRPLVTAREVDAAFGWAEVSPQIRRIRAEDVTVYVRSNGPSPLSLLNLLPGPPREPNRGTVPLRIDALDVRGASHLEAVRGFVPANGEWPLRLRMTTSGNRLDPARRFRMVIGDSRQVPASNGDATASSPAPDAPFGLRAEVATQPAAGGTRVVLHRLAARQAALTIDADLLRQYVPELPPELEGRIETGVGNLWASGELDRQGPANGQQLAGSLAFAGLRVRVPSGSRVTLSLDDLAAAARIDTPVPPGPGTTITIERLRARDTKASIEADALRRYVPRLPDELHGRIDANLGALEVSGRIGSGTGEAVGFSGTIRLRDLSAHAPASGAHALVLDRLTAAGSVEAPLDRWAPAAVAVRDGVTRWAALTYGNSVLRNLDAFWRIEGHMLTADRCAVQLFGGHISGSPAWDLVNHAMPPCDLRITGIDMHEALANISPEHLDAKGKASGLLHLALGTQGDLSGHVDLAFDGPGILRIGEIEEVKRMLVGNFGLDLANLAVLDLKQYPFKEGRAYLESSGRDSQLKIKFVRQSRTDADTRPPHKQIINGQEVWVGSLIVPTIDMTIPITGKSLAEILSMVSGVHPVINAAGEQPGQ
jgi:hypothetical protein